MEFAVRASLYGAVIVMIGTLVFSTAVLGGVGARAPLVPPIRSRAARAGMIAALLIIPVALARLYFQLDGMRFPGEPLTQSLHPLMTQTVWGKGWVLQVGGAILAAFAFAGMRSSSRRATVSEVLAILAVLAVAISLPHSGHAAGVSSLLFVAIAADAVHVAAAGAWLGTLTMLVGAMVHLSRSRGDQTSAELSAALVHGFSPIALISAAVVTVTGVVSALMHIPSLAALFASGYGRILMAKVFLVAIILFAGYRNWKHNTPRMSVDGGSSLRRGAMVELAVAVLVVLLTSALVVTPPPLE